MTRPTHTVEAVADADVSVRNIVSVAVAAAAADDALMLYAPVPARAPLAEVGHTLT